MAGSQDNAQPPINEPLVPLSLIDEPNLNLPMPLSEPISPLADTNAENIKAAHTNKWANKLIRENEDKQIEEAIIIDERGGAQDYHN
jgi:hypothetical protein